MKTQNKTMTAKQFMDALTQGEIVPNGTEVILEEGVVFCVVQDVKGLKRFPGVKFVGNLFVVDCPDLETVDPELTVTGEFQINTCPELVSIHNTMSSSVVVWMCPKIVELPELTHEGLESVRIAGVGCTRISNITTKAIPEADVRFYQCNNLVEVSDIHSAILAFTESPELEIVKDIAVTQMLEFNGCPKLTELPNIGEGNHLEMMMLANTGVKIVPDNYFQVGVDKPIVEHSHVLFVNNPDLHTIPPVVAEELDVLHCPEVRIIRSGTRVNMLELNDWSVQCEPGVIINDKLRIEDGSVDIEDFLNNRVVKPETPSSESDEEYDILGP